MSFRAETQSEGPSFFLSLRGKDRHGFVWQMSHVDRRKLAFALFYVSPGDGDDSGEAIDLGACVLTLNTAPLPPAAPAPPASRRRRRARLPRRHGRAPRLVRLDPSAKGSP